MESSSHFQTPHPFPTFSPRLCFPRNAIYFYDYYIRNPFPVRSPAARWHLNGAFFM